VEISITKEMCGVKKKSAGNVSNQNQPLRYAIHQLRMHIGIVAAIPHQKGRIKSATSPKIVKLAQNIFLCTYSF
jgi:hypothetical protein